LVSLKPWEKEIEYILSIRATTFGNFLKTYLYERSNVAAPMTIDSIPTEDSETIILQNGKNKLLHNYHHIDRSDISFIYRVIIDPHNNQLPVGLIAQLVEHCTGSAEVRVRVLNFLCLLLTTT